MIIRYAVPLKLMPLPSKHIILQLSNQGIFYNPMEAISLAKTNLPSADTFAFKAFYQIYWIVKMVKFDAEKGILSVEPTDYSPSEFSAFSTQKPKLALKEIHFQNLAWEELEAHLSYYQPKAFEHLLKESPNPSTAHQESISIAEQPDFSDTFHLRRLSLSFSFPIREMTFKMGYVEFQKKDKDLKDQIIVKISNDAILPEFEHIKGYFVKALGRKRAAVEGYLLMDGDTIVEQHFRSPQIAAINEQLIATIRQLKIREVAKTPPVIAVDKSLFTNEDFFEGFDEAELGNTLQVSEKEILEELLQLKGIRNKRQLEYLAGKLHNPKERIRFTLNPNFGFLFQVEGDTMDHFIWELLDSHATYIWSIDRGELNRSAQLKAIDQLINFIRTNGRNAYLSNPQEHEFAFSKITHESKGLVDGFPKWRVRVQEVLV